MLKKMERKFGRFAIRNLMAYVIMLYIAGYFLYWISPDFYSNWLMLDIDMLLKGQVWRLVTFLIQPMDNTNVFFAAISLYLYYTIGSNLERKWGSFRFNVFYFGGVLCNILAVVIIYAVTLLVFGVHFSYPIGLDYINLSLFLAFAAEYSEVQLLLFFVLPIKVKWLGIAYGAFYAYDIVRLILSARGSRTLMLYAIGCAVALFVAILNFLLFFLLNRRQKHEQRARRRSYTESVERGYTYGGVGRNPETGRAVITRHKCAICGRTELDGDDLEFRFCSKCSGSYEYCMEHLFTHTHVGNSGQ